MTDFEPDNLAEPPAEPVVHWMDEQPSQIGPVVLAGALGGVFLVGALVGAGLLAFLHGMRRTERGA